MKNFLILGLILTLAGCGGYHKAKRERGTVVRSSPQTISQPIAITPNAQPVITQAAATTPVTRSVAKPFATGPLQSACINSDRKARSRELCGCIQAVANRTLNSSQQSRAVGFYADPHRAQEIRMSERPTDERFWEDYINYAENAKRTCR